MTRVANAMMQTRVANSKRYVAIVIALVTIDISIMHAAKKARLNNTRVAN